MRKRCLTLLEGAGLFLAGAFLFFFPAQSAQGARAGVELCLELLIPALFPFFVLSSLFISTGLAQACFQPLEGIIRRLFGVSGPGAAAFCLGLIGGYPTGARAVAQLREQGACSQKEAQRLSLFCNNRMDRVNADRTEAVTQQCPRDIGGAVFHKHGNVRRRDIQSVPYT